jgi:hypothetical protein
MNNEQCPSPSFSILSQNLYFSNRLKMDILFSQICDDTRPNDIQSVMTKLLHSACYYTFSTVMLTVFMMGLIMLSVIILNVIILGPIL